MGSDLLLRTIRALLLGIASLAALVFVPAWTLAYWQGWAFLGVFLASGSTITVYLARRDPALLERRLHRGPKAETEPRQKVIMSLGSLVFLALPTLCALDWRFGWSTVPAGASIFGDALIALGYLLLFFVLRENTYSAATIQVVEGQTVVSTGPYAIVRHPMYASSIVMMAGIPPALGSWWGLLIMLAVVPVLAWRLLDEERFLHANLSGYTEYTRKVRYRLIPYVW